MKNRTSMLIVAGAIVALALVVLGAVQGPAFAALDTTPPSVVITAPSPGAAIHNGQALGATASDASGIANVAFRYCTGATCTWATGKVIGSATAAPYTVSWTAQPGDGSYALLARATDKAGNVATTAALAVTVDNTAPATTIVTRPPLVAPTASAIFTFSSEAKATFQCSLDGAAFTVCASPKSYTGLTAGWHVFRVRAVDRAGNVDASPETAYWYVNVATDTTPPETTITAQPSALTSATGATFSFSSEAGATFACSLDGAAFGTCTSSKSYSAITDGSHTFAVRATDAAGNTDPTPASASWTVDTTAPDTVIGAHPSSPTNSTSATFTFSSEAGAKFACKLDAAGYTSCNSPTGLSGLKDGSHTFSVRATDAAGNTDQTAASFDWTVDTVAPAVSFTDQPASPTNKTTGHFDFSSEAGAKFECSLDGEVFYSCLPPENVPVEQGDHAFAVRATDAAGNTSVPAKVSWTVDTVAPDVTIVESPRATTSSTAAHFVFSSEPRATFECSVDKATFSTCASPIDLSGLKDGSRTFAVRATDAAGNTGAASLVAWTVDTVAPDTIIGSGPDALTKTTDARFTFSSSEEATFECKLDRGLFQTCSSPNLLGGLAEGAHTFSVRATDAAGNIDGSPATASWTVDTVAPETTIDTHPSGLTRETSATFAFSSESGATFACKLDGASFSSCDSPLVVSSLKDGGHTFSVRATDAAGNSDATPATFDWTVDATAPNTTLDSHPASPTNEASASFVFSSEPGATFECELDAAGYASCGSPVGLSGLKDGSHTFSVRATDSAGNTDQTAASFDWTVDTVAPAVTFTDQPASPTNKTTGHFDFSSEAGAKFECSLDGEVFYSCLPPENVPVEQGDHAFAVRATDKAGNTGSATVNWTVDTVAPDVTIVESPRASTSSTAAHFVFSSEPLATFECSVDKAPFSTCASPLDLTGLTDGDHSFAVQATDEADNTGDPGLIAWTVDTRAPETTIDSGPAALAAASNTRFTFSSSEAATFECKLDGADYASCNSPNDLSELADGSHTFSVRATDAAGNTDATAALYEWTTDAAAPTVSITSPEANATVHGVVSVAADVTDGNGIGGVQFKVDDVPLGPEDTSSAPYGVSWDTTAASNGPHKLTVESRDTAGNVTTTSIDVTVSNVQATTTTPGLIAVGPGYVDATARQVVRTSDNRAYIIAVDDSAFKTYTGSAVIRAWKADTTGVPTGFAEVGATNEPHPGASGVNNIVGVDLRLDRSTGIVHTVRAESGGGGNLVYQTFDTNTDSWSSTDEDLASPVPVTGRGRGTFALALDAAGNPHVVYVSGGTLYYRGRVGASWSPPVPLATGENLLHPSMSFDADGNLHVAWLDDVVGAPAVEYKEMHADGTWGATETVATGDVLTNHNADQAVSVAANTAGVPYVLYLSGSLGAFGSSHALFGAVQIRYRTADGWQSDNPAPALLAHTPQLYLHGDDVYAFLGHDTDGHLAYVVHQPGRPWSNKQLLSATGDGFLDGSASVRLDVPDASPNVIDAVFYNEDKLGDNSDLPQLYYRGITPTAPPAPDTTAPSVSINAPAANAILTGSFVVTAQASDDVGVTSVQFKLDGADLGPAAETAPYAFRWETSMASEGTHMLTAIARDAAGHETTSEAVTVTVQNTAPPAALVTLLGSDAIGASHDYNDEGVAEAFQVAASATGTLRNLQVYVGDDSVATSVLVGIYADDGGQPGALLTQTALVLPKTGAWNTVSMPEYSIESGATYWIALLAPTGAGRVTFRDAPSGGLAVVDSGAGTELPTTWTTTSSWNNAPLSAFGTT